MKHIISKGAASLVGLLILGVVAPALAGVSLAGKPEISFVALGPAGLKIVGTGADLQISDDGKTVLASVMLTTFTTGIDLRDKHMRGEKCFDVQNYPKAEFRFDRAAIKTPAPGQTSSGELPGRLLFHGQEKPISAHYTVAGENDRMNVNASMRLDIRNFGIAPPSYFGMSVKPDVDVSIRFPVRGDH
jgi:polyisoprenoid-binding protein YceI